MKTVLITGTSRGIGLALAKIFLNKGCQVIGACRTDQQDISEDENFKTFALDLSDIKSIKKFEKEISTHNIQIDILINNAAIGSDLDTSIPEEISFRQTFEINVTGTTFFTELMLMYMKPGGKIINISSKMGSVSLCEQYDSVAYRMSKAALNMYTKILTNRLAGKQSVAAVHPGWVRTTLAKSNINGRLSTEESAQKIFDFISNDFKTGTFWNAEIQKECEW